MVNSLANTFDVARTCCDVLQQTSHYADIPSAMNKIDTAVRTANRKGPKDQLWSKTENLLLLSTALPKEYKSLKDLEEWHANVYRFIATALSIRTFLMKWCEITSQACNIEYDDLLDTRCALEEDFEGPRISAITGIGEETVRSLRARKIGNFESWLDRKYKLHMLRDPSRHVEVIYPHNMWVEPCGFYTLSKEEVKRPQFDNRQRDFGDGVVLTTNHLPAEVLKLERFGMKDADGVEIHGGETEVVQMEVALQIAFCMMRQVIEKGPPLALPVIKPVPPIVIVD